MQFIYDASGVGTPTGAWLCVTLGVWHPYKQANSVVWSHWGPPLLPPHRPWVQLPRKSPTHHHHFLLHLHPLQRSPTCAVWSFSVFLWPQPCTLSAWVVWRCVPPGTWRAMRQQCININAMLHDHSHCININDLCVRSATTVARSRWTQARTCLPPRRAC